MVQKNTLRNRIEVDYHNAVQNLAMFTKKKDDAAMAFWLGVATGLAHVFFDSTLSSNEVFAHVTNDVQAVMEARNYTSEKFDA